MEYAKSSQQQNVYWDIHLLIRASQWIKEQAIETKKGDFFCYKFDRDSYDTDAVYPFSIWCMQYVMQLPKDALAEFKVYVAREKVAK
jgi:hypothetical protein